MQGLATAQRQHQPRWGHILARAERLSAQIQRERKQYYDPLEATQSSHRDANLFMHKQLAVDKFRSRLFRVGCKH
jgi:hypothetical protein